jgi:ubiquinone/menaquinone biosynthesis C-methylase UbiE
MSIPMRRVVFRTPVLWIGACLLFVSQCRLSSEPESEAARFDRIAKSVFKEVYPGLAEQILADYPVRGGLCVDLGCGPAYLTIEMAKRSGLRFIGVDIDSEAVAIAGRNVRKAGLSDRIRVETGDAQRLRFGDGIVDLVVSRGSFPFWQDRVQAFREILRILKPGGVAFVGGGMGRSISKEKKESIRKQLIELGFWKDGKNPVSAVSRFEMEETLELAGITRYRIFGDGPGDSGCKCGMWIEIRK